MNWHCCSIVCPYMYSCGCGGKLGKTVHRLLYIYIYILTQLVQEWQLHFRDSYINTWSTFSHALMLSLVSRRSLGICFGPAVTMSSQTQTWEGHKDNSVFLNRTQSKQNSNTRKTKPTCYLLQQRKRNTWQDYHHKESLLIDNASFINRHIWVLLPHTITTKNYISLKKGNKKLLQCSKDIQ